MEFLPGNFMGDQVQHPLTVVIRIFLRLKRCGQLRYQQLGHIQLFIAHHARFRQSGNLGDRPHLIGIKDGLNRQAVLQHTNGGQAAFGADRNLGNPDLACLAHRFHQQPVSIGARLVRRQVVGLLEINRVNLRQIHKIEDRNTFTALLGQLVQLLFVEQDKLSFFILIAFADLFPAHFLVTYRAFAYIGQRTSAFLVDVPQ
ncbi:hypothetical protein D3C75_927150 [compost metagenome]